MTTCQKNVKIQVCEFRAIVFNAVSVQIFKKINVPSILPAHKKQWRQNISEAEFSVLFKQGRNNRGDRSHLNFQIPQPYSNQGEQILPLHCKGYTKKIPPCFLNTQDKFL